MENGKSAGVEGIPTEFYKEFLENIEKDLQKTFNDTKNMEPSNNNTDTKKKVIQICLNI